MTQHHTLHSLTEVLPLLDQKTTIRGVVFDLFGTLLHIERPLKPYRTLFNQAGAVLTPHQFSVAAMTTPLCVGDFIRTLNAKKTDGVPIDSEWIESLLIQEVESIRLHSDVPRTLTELHMRGIPFSCLSNLAMPYAQPAERLLSEFIPRSMLYSFNLGVLKPDPSAFLMAADALHLHPSCLMMVGDSRSSDVVGADRAAYGHAVHLVRTEQ
jgi:FMN phosphatase YigB (HAD superfamily)